MRTTLTVIVLLLLLATCCLLLPDAIDQALTEQEANPDGINREHIIRNLKGD